jgi:hypothetical protein
MSGGFTTLRDFSESELIFDEAETKHILKFFFQPLRQRIDAATMTTEMRSFAQGLLVEAIDATYALGYIEILLKTYYNPGAGMKAALSKIGRRAAQHWFKHATQRDLLSAKISSRVRDQLALNFKTHFQLLLDELADATKRRKTNVAYLRYGQPSKSDTLWG